MRFLKFNKNSINIEGIESIESLRKEQCVVRMLSGRSIRLDVGSEKVFDAIFDSKQDAVADLAEMNVSTVLSAARKSKFL